MRRFSIAAGSMALVGLTACANHPLVDDATGLSTFEIIERVKCEAREPIVRFYEVRELSGQAHERKARSSHGDRLVAADKAQEERLRIVMEKAAVKRVLQQRGELDAKDQAREGLLAQLAGILGQLTYLDDQLKLPAPPNKDQIIATIEELKKQIWTNALESSKLARELAEIRANLERLRSAEAEYRSVKRASELAKRALQAHTGAMVDHKAVEAFENTQFYMKFEFTIDDDDNTKFGETKLVLPVPTGGNVTVNFGVQSADRKRKGKRLVEVIASFDELRKMECHQVPRMTTNTRAKRYPVTGYIGVRDFIDTYINVKTTLAQLHKKPTADSNVERFEDELTFVTELKTGDINPTFLLKPLRSSKAESELSGGFGLSGTRKDHHLVKIVIVPPVAPTPATRVQ